MKTKNYLLLGAGLGMVAGYFMNSNAGRQKRTEMADFISNQQNKLIENGNALVEEAKALVSKANVNNSTN